MMLYFNNFMILPFLSSCLLFSNNHKYILLTLISLEFMTINTMYMIYYLYPMMKFDFYLLIFILTMWVCEGVLGLTLLVYILRHSGNDYLKLLNLNKW